MNPATEPAPRPKLTLPIRVKAVLWWQGRILLLQAPHGGWGLPGGHLEPGEQPLECLVREIAEEVGWRVTPGRMLGSWVSASRLGRPVLTVCVQVRYGGSDAPVLSAEHRAYDLFASDEITALGLDEVYQRAIALSAAPSA